MWRLETADLYIFICPEIVETRDSQPVYILVSTKCGEPETAILCTFRSPQIVETGDR